MFRTLREDWRRLKRGVPGQRFQDVYKARRKRKKGKWSRYLWLVVGGMLIVVGPIAGLIPGPGGIVVFLVGLALLARELRAAALVLDWCEPRIRKGWQSAKLAWHESATARFAFCLVGLAVLGCGYAGYVWFAGNH